MSEQYRDCPSCPEIKKKIDRIDVALLGPDGTGMKEGIVYAIKDLQQNSKVRSSWIDAWKPVIYAAISVVISVVITFGASRFFGT